MTDQSKCFCLPDYKRKTNEKTQILGHLQQYLPRVTGWMLIKRQSSLHKDWARDSSTFHTVLPGQGLSTPPAAANICHQHDRAGGPFPPQRRKRSTGSLQVTQGSQRIASLPTLAPGRACVAAIGKPCSI